jgi:hypothetical protein
MRQVLRDAAAVFSATQSLAGKFKILCCRPKFAKRTYTGSIFEGNISKHNSARNCRQSSSLPFGNNGAFLKRIILFLRFDKTVSRSPPRPPSPIFAHKNNLQPGHKRHQPRTTCSNPVANAVDAPAQLLYPNCAIYYFRISLPTIISRTRFCERKKEALSSASDAAATMLREREREELCRTAN